MERRYYVVQLPNEFIYLEVTSENIADAIIDLMSNYPESIKIEHVPIDEIKESEFLTNIFLNVG